MTLVKFLWVVLTGWTSLSTPKLLLRQQPATKKTFISVGVRPQLFDTPHRAADALIDASQRFDVRALQEILGLNGEDIVLSGEYPQDRKRASDFAAVAREKKSISVDPKDATRAFVVVGRQEWRFPAPLVKHGNKWSFDSDGTALSSHRI